MEPEKSQKLESQQSGMTDEEAAGTWWSQGNELLNSGCYENALNRYNKAIEIKPDFHKAWSNRGTVLCQLERLEEAIASYDKALAFKPEDCLAWFNRGKALFQLERLEEAIATDVFEMLSQVRQGVIDRATE